MSIGFRWQQDSFSKQSTLEYRIIVRQKVPLSCSWWNHPIFSFLSLEWCCIQSIQ